MEQNYYNNQEQYKQHMKSQTENQNFLKRILQDQKLQREWESQFKNKISGNYSSEQETDNSEYENKMLEKLNKIQFKNLNVHNPEADKISQITSKLQKKTIELEEFKVQALYIVQENYSLKKNLNEISLILKDLGEFLQTKLQKSSLEKLPIRFEDWINKPTEAIKQIKKLFIRIGVGQYKELQFEKEQKLQKVIEQNNNLMKINEGLLAHIEQRRIYSESLKQKILSLKEQLKAHENKHQIKEEIKKELQKFQQKIDLKYVNRNDLILILKNLFQKIIKHNKESSDEASKINLDDLEKYYVKDFSKNTRPKNGSRQKNIV